MSSIAAHLIGPGVSISTIIFYLPIKATDSTVVVGWFDDGRQDVTLASSSFCA